MDNLADGSLNPESRSTAAPEVDRVPTSGARFYRCALQVNPFAYLKRHNKSTEFESEGEYNKAMVETCQEAGIEVIAVTDHYRVKDSMDLVEAARDAGIFVFPGFEAKSKDGVHFLCLFDQNATEDSLERIIGECGIHDFNALSPTGNLDAMELLDRANEWGAVCVAAHAIAGGGLLKELSGQPCINVWKSPNLLACALPGSVSATGDDIRRILENKDAQYKRDRLPAFLNASDVDSPKKLREDRASCFIKMSSVSVEALRQAFLDPEFRVRLHSDEKLAPHTEFLRMRWKGGFLDGTAVAFSENLNVLIGGRGTGKSTVIESIRYVLGLEPLGEQVRKAHEGMVRQVLKSGTKISMDVRLHKPSRRLYRIERTVPNPPVVKDQGGNVLPLLPSDVMPHVEIFGQHEISELAQKPAKLTRLLERFASRDPELSSRKVKIQRELERSRNRISDTLREIGELEDRISSLPGLEEMQKRFQQAGLEERLKEKGLLVREERLLAALQERLEQYRTLQIELGENLPIDTAFVSAKALEGLPNADILSENAKILLLLNERLEGVGKQLANALAEAERGIEAMKLRWKERRAASEKDYEKILRELQKSEIDGAEFIRLRRQIEELRPLKEKMQRLKRDLEAHEARRHELLIEWEATKIAEYQEIQTAAEKVSRKLKERVQVTVTMAGDKRPLSLLLHEIEYVRSEAIDRICSSVPISLSDLVQRCRAGKESLIEHYHISSRSAERIAQAPPDLLMKIEELELPTTTEVELNTAPKGKPAAWKKLPSLSTGQKTTAILLLLLLESEAPLVVDQPEDDLDNRFITEAVVPLMRQGKQRRQFVFSTHNANIPVLGDAELILGLHATGDAEHGNAKIPVEHMGSIDSRPVRELVEDILEGGKEAFETRFVKYGF